MTSHKVLIAQFRTSVEVRPGFSILDAALKAGLDYPYACRQGNCSSCKTNLIKGKIEHKPFDPAALSEEEQGNNIILACRAMPLTDCEVEFMEDDELTFTPAKSECEITSVERVTRDVVVVKAKALVKRSILFAAGQFATIALPGLPAREYSFANRPGSQELEFHVRARPSGKVSRRLYEESQIGDRFVLNAPFGNAYLRKDHGGPITIVVGGTGLAPAKSIILDALASLPGRAITLYFSVREMGDLYQVDQFEALASRYTNFQFSPVVTRPIDGSAERSVDVFQLIADQCQSLRGHKVYTCGSPGLVKACQIFSQRMGVEAKDCHADPFVSADDDEVSG
jgi:ferredoxin-NAD(P)+ reductase (naphthalene dioxygenase ferredoxin-specific)